MKRTVFGSPAIAKEIKKLYGDKARVVQVELRHEEDIRDYVMRIEEAHKKAAKSKLRFGTLIPH